MLAPFVALLEYSEPYVRILMAAALCVGFVFGGIDIHSDTHTPAPCLKFHIILRSVSSFAAAWYLAWKTILHKYDVFKDILGNRINSCN